MRQTNLFFLCNYVDTCIAPQYAAFHRNSVLSSALFVISLNCSYSQIKRPNQDTLRIAILLVAAEKPQIAVEIS